jgi:hypothetical protein
MGIMMMMMMMTIIIQSKRSDYIKLYDFRCCLHFPAERDYLFLL